MIHREARFNFPPKILEFPQIYCILRNMNDTKTSAKHSCWKTIILVFAVAALLLAFSGCFSPWAGDGTLTINLDGGDSSRAVINPADIANFEYEIILEGPGGKITKSVKGGGSITVELTAGTWDLMLRAIGDRPDDDPLGDYMFTVHYPPRMLRALGFDNAVDVKAGKNTNVTLKMKAAIEISNPDQLELAYHEFSDTPVIWIIKESFEYDGILELMGQDLTLITDNSGKEVTLTCTDDLSSPGNEAIFDLYMSGKPSILTLGRPGMKGWLVIDGGGKEGYVKSGSLFRVNDSGCKLEMFDGVKLCNNFNEGYYGYSAYGGGVRVEYGAFIMNGGEISGNKAAANGTSGGFGGGVWVDSGSFIMNGGEISGNEAEAYGSSGGFGGGLYIDHDASAYYSHFEKTGGVIYGGTAGKKSNIADAPNNGHAVYNANTPPKYRDDDVWDNISYDRSRLGEEYSGRWNE